MRSLPAGVLVLVLHCAVTSLFVAQSSAARIYFEKCDYKGFSCVKSPKTAGKYDLTFVCNSFSGWDIELYLWQFRALSSISSIKVANCTSLRLNLICTSEGRPIQTFHALNITKLSFTPVVHGLAHSAPEMIFEDIQEMDTIPSRTFIQIKRYPFSKFGCANPAKDLETITFKNVRVDFTERMAFHNLSDIKNFTFENVTIHRMHATSVQVFLAKDGELRLVKNSIGVMEYLSFHVIGPKLLFQLNSIQEMHSSAVNATVYDLNFVQNSIGWVHCAALSILAQNVKIIDNTFDYIATGAFQAIGPGLPENSLRGFGRLKFLYEFKNNLIESLEVASLHSDWRAYNNVGSIITVSYNTIKCSCAELAWLGMKEGFGRDYSGLNAFHASILKKENNNICADAPCILPVETVQLMMIKDGRCQHNVTQEYICSVYYPPTDVTTLKTTTHKATFVKNSNPVLYQRRLALKSGARLLQCNAVIITFLIVFYAFSMIFYLIEHKM